ncbi:MAG: DUF1552 domain-containing protein [Planctomycetota bacterium]
MMHPTPLAFRNLSLSRRRFLRGSGAALALPFLSAMQPAVARTRGDELPKRFVAICGGLGFHAPFLFPERPGPLTSSTPYLAKLEEHHQQITLFSGLSHPNQNGNNGHASEMTWLTSAQRPGLAGFRNTISLDQQIAARIGGQTRFPYFCLANSSGSLSWTASGVNIPAESSPARLFKQMFVSGSDDEVESQLRDLEKGRSILDTIRQDAKQLARGLGHKDRHKLDQYYDSIRDLEVRIGQSQQWTKKPKPRVDHDIPSDVTDKQDIIGRQRLMYDMIRLAIESDSTRVVTLSLGALNSVPSNLPGVQTDWHNLSHHGKDDEKISELRLVEEAEFDAFAAFLNDLKTVSEAGQNLLDRTSILFGSNLGNASSHDWHNLPIIVAGGGYRHGNYVAHDSKDNTPFANLFVPLAQRMGLEIDQFGSSTNATVSGLEEASGNG